MSRPCQEVVGSCRQVGKRQLHARTLFATRLVTCREDFQLVHAPWTTVVLEAVVQGLGRKLLVLTQLSLLQPLSKGRAVHLTLKLETPVEPQTDSFTAEVLARHRVEQLIAPWSLKRLWCFSSGHSQQNLLHGKSLAGLRGSPGTAI